MPWKGSGMMTRPGLGLLSAREGREGMMRLESFILSSGFEERRLKIA